MPSEINQLHAAYCAATGLDLALNACSERQWFEAAKMGVTPEDVQLAVKWRIRQTAQKNGSWSLLIKRLVGDEDAVGELLNQAAMARAELRQRVMDPGKASALAATGRPTVLPDPGPRPAREAIAAGLDKLRKAAGE